MMDPNEDGDVAMSAPTTPTASPLKTTPPPDKHDEGEGEGEGEGEMEGEMEGEGDGEGDEGFEDAIGNSMSSNSKSSLSPSSSKAEAEAEAAFDKDEYLESLVCMVYGVWCVVHDYLESLMLVYGVVDGVWWLCCDATTPDPTPPPRHATPCHAAPHH